MNLHKAQPNTAGPGSTSPAITPDVALAAPLLGGSQALTPVHLQGFLCLQTEDREL